MAKMKEIDRLNDFENWLKQGETPAAIQALDLSNYEDQLLKAAFPESIFLGCTMSNEVAGHIVKTGGQVISNRRDVSFTVHRAQLYSPEELFEGFDLRQENGYKLTYDYKVYEEYADQGMANPGSISVSLSRRLHDHSITDALEEIIAGKKVVAIMGGHSMERKDPYYLRIARIAQQLTRKGFLMVSGGGPGAMEATHLGAYFACRSETELEGAINEMKIRPPGSPEGKEYADKDWLHRAWRIYRQYPVPEENIEKSMSIGIPTWHYGHEPPAVFATHIAKYFANSVREDGLLAIAKHGVIFAPGSAGTTQEIFQDAAQNHYAPYNTSVYKSFVSPMVLFGIERWTRDRPVWELIKKVSEGHPYGELLHLSEDEEEIIEIILSYDPERYVYPQD